MKTEHGEKARKAIADIAAIMNSLSVTDRAHVEACFANSSLVYSKDGEAIWTPGEDSFAEDRSKAKEDVVREIEAWSRFASRDGYAPGIKD